LKRKLTDTVSEIRRPLQMSGIVARHRAALQSTSELLPYQIGQIPLIGAA
jgi:hypothetical protein